MADEKDIVFNDIAPPPINIINFDSYRINNNNSWSHHEIVEEDDDDDDGVYKGSKSLPSIIEEYENGDMFSYGNVSDVVYVVTWKGTEELLSASMDALLWTLGNSLHESTLVYLVYVFPELRFIPTPR
ncbi:hypothetical protein Tco_1519182, partial [Tanacetum coccineum]